MLHAKVFTLPEWSKRQGHIRPLKAPTCLTPSKTPQISLGLPNETSVGKVPKRIPTPILLERNSLILRVSSIWGDQLASPTHLNFRSMIFPEISQQSHHNALGIVGQVIFALISAKKTRHSPSQCYPDFTETWMGYNGIRWTQTLDLDISWTNMISSTLHKKKHLKVHGALNFLVRIVWRGGEVWI